MSSNTISMFCGELQRSQAISAIFNLYHNFELKEITHLDAASIHGFRYNLILTILEMAFADDYVIIANSEAIAMIINTTIDMLDNPSK